MAVELVIAPEAEGDVAEAHAQYETERPGLGAAFLGRFRRCVEGLVRHPEMHPRAVKNYRRALLRPYPYFVIYEFEAGVVSVYGVFHASRDDRAWRSRLSQ